LLLELENSGEAEMTFADGSVIWGQKPTIVQRPITMAAEALPLKPCLSRTNIEWYIGS
jgi:hypothetical protein